jgi:predicted membrane channel-forming protein YqfA (hemolysin III family)
MWILTLAAAAVRMAWPTAPELVAGVVFIGLGCAGGLALPWVWIHAGAASGALLVVGGLLYIAGALSSPLARPLSVGVRLPRGLSRLRLRRRGLPVRRDSPVYRLSWAPRIACRRYRA